MEDVSLTDTESRYFGDLFLCCDEEKTGKIPILKAKELYRSANLADDVIDAITSLAGIPDAALHISRAQFYSCLKLIAAQQVGMPLRQELLAATVVLPLPRFSWKEESTPKLVDVVALHQQHHQLQLNGLSALPSQLVTDRRNSLPRRCVTDWQDGVVAASRRNSAVDRLQEAAANSDVPSTDSEIEQNESSCGGGDGGVGTGSSSRDTHHQRRRGSPEAWSTNSDSPTPTNSVAERPWAKETMWCDEHRQLLGTEEESSDRHSSDDDNNDTDLVYQITPEQREYYVKQFRAVQHDINGLLSGQVARVFFEKSRIPVEELRHIWQLCDVTRDGALSLAEFTAAMHLVVLRRNNIALPGLLPACLHPSVLHHTTLPAGVQQQPQEPPEADLLHLNDDEDITADNTVVGGTQLANEQNAMNASTMSQASTGTGVVTASTTPPPPLALASSVAAAVVNSSVTSSPNGAEPADTSPTLHGSMAAMKSKDRSLWSTTADVPPTQWTKFTESPTTNVSSPGPKPVNFDMQRTAQAVVSDPQILHPVPLRVTPVAGVLAGATTGDLQPDTDTSNSILRESPKQLLPQQSTTATSTSSSSSQNSSDLRAIQRPQAKKLPAKNIGALPPPPQRESISIGSSMVSMGESGGNSSVSGTGAVAAGVGQVSVAAAQQQQLHVASFNKKEPPPLPPPRPHRHHGRSSSLDLNRLKMGSGPQPEMTAQVSFDLQTSTGFADFTNFPDGTNLNDRLPEQQQHSLPHASTSTGAVCATVPIVSIPAPPAALPPTRFSLQSNQRVSAFEVYRKPNTPHTQSPTTTQPPLLPPAPFGAMGAAAIIAQQQQHGCSQPPSSMPNAEVYEKRVHAISETLRHINFRQDSSRNSSSNNNMGDVLRHLREQNNLLLRLCNDLSDELLTVQTRKEEMRLKMEAATVVIVASAGKMLPRTGSSVSAPVTATITGGSGSSGGHV